MDTQVKCVYCEEMFTYKLSVGRTPRYCSAKCRSRWHYYKNQKSKPTENATPCAYCGEKFMRGAYDTKYCSAQCRSADAIKNTDQICERCGATYRHKQLRMRKYCSDACRLESLHEHNKKIGAFEGSVERVCAYCGKEYLAPANVAHHKYCSTYCCNGAWSQKRRMFEKKAYREEYTKQEVVDRDDGVCQICGERVDLSLRHPHPKSLSIDHIIPLSKGGADILDNVQASHLVCNFRKGDKLL